MSTQTITKNREIVRHLGLTATPRANPTDSTSHDVTCDACGIKVGTLHSYIDHADRSVLMPNWWPRKLPDVLSLRDAWTINDTLVSLSLCHRAEGCKGHHSRKADR